MGFLPLQNYLQGVWRLSLAQPETRLPFMVPRPPYLEPSKKIPSSPISDVHPHAYKDTWPHPYYPLQLPHLPQPIHSHLHDLLHNPLSPSILAHTCMCIKPYTIIKLSQILLSTLSACLSVCLSISFLLNMVPHCSPGCPATHCVDQATGGTQRATYLCLSNAKTNL